MKKKLWIPITAAVLIVCVAAGLILYFLIGSGISQAEDPNVSMLAELESMFANADHMLASGEVISNHNHKYLGYFIGYAEEYYPEAFSYTDETYYIDTAKLASDMEEVEKGTQEWTRQQSLRYLLLLSQLIEKFSDSIFLFGVLPGESHSVAFEGTCLHLCYNYQEAGYKSASEYYDAYKDLAFSAAQKDNDNDQPSILVISLTGASIYIKTPDKIVSPDYFAEFSAK